LIDKLSFLKSGLDGTSASAEEERLMQLFQNRAGLKKAYADLQDELHLLRDRLKQQEGATIRVQEQIDALGELLAGPDTGFAALVFYQLRSLWKTCHQQLAAFATELTRQQETRESAKHQEEREQERSARRAEADGRLKAAAAEADQKREQLNQADAEYQRLTAFWHYFKRRRLQRNLDALRSELVAAEAVVGHVHAECQAIEAEVLAPFPGISLAARRGINLAIIAYAELVCELVDAFGLTARTKEAMARRVHEMSFGTRADCEGYMLRVQKAIAAVSSQKQINSQVKARLERLRGTCEYRNSADTVPTADSLANAQGSVGKSAKAAPATPSASPWNVLAEDYWDLYTLLLR
jgi:hypothetical protein